MSNFGSHIKQLRESKNMTLNQLALYAEISAAQLSRIETGKRGTPKPATIEKIASALKVDYNDLMEVAGYLNNDNRSSDLTEKEEQDLVADLQKILDGFEGNFASYDGKTPEEIEDQELLKAALQQSMRLAKRVAKEKFTPNKYKK